MLCYRFMTKNPGFYVKHYDSEILPLLLRRPVASIYNNSAQYSGNPVSVQRSPRLLFHWSPRSLNIKDARPDPTPKAVEEPNTDVAPKTDSDPLVPEEKLGLFARFKKMYKEYWYVLLPVHCVTSACWLGGFYYVSISGFDVASLMESWHFNEIIVNHLRDSKLGHVAIAYFLYKCFTPIRYMVTLGGTTLSIKHLSRLGYIKPVPSKSALMKLYQDKKDSAKHAIHKKTHGGSSSI